MRCVYCDKELKSSADDYKSCICSECKKPKYPFQQGIIEQQNKIAELERENKELKEQLAIREKALEIADEQFNSINYRYFDESNVDFKSEWLEQAKESIKDV